MILLTLSLKSITKICWKWVAYLKKKVWITTLFQSIKLRLPWLLINLITAFMASFTVKVFEGTIAQVVALSSIMTIISGMGGNAGSQTQSILVRQIATDKVDFKRNWKSFVKKSS